MDLPGFQRPRDPLTERMQRTVDSSFSDVDAILFVLAADEEIGAGDRFIAKRVFGGPAPVIVALNKIDRVKPERVPAQIAQAAALGDFHALHPRERADRGGVDALRDELVALLPEGPAYFPDDEITDMLARGADRRARPRAGARADKEEVPHAVTVEVAEIEGGSRLGGALRGDRIPKGDPGRQGRQL